MLALNWIVGHIKLESVWKGSLCYFGPWLNPFSHMTADKSPTNVSRWRWRDNYTLCHHITNIHSCIIQAREECIKSVSAKKGLGAELKSVLLSSHASSRHRQLWLKDTACNTYDLNHRWVQGCLLQKIKRKNSTECARTLVWRLVSKSAAYRLVCSSQCWQVNVT